MALTIGAELEPDSIELWLEELALNPWARGLEWSQEPAPQRLEDFSVTVIGAGNGKASTQPFSSSEPGFRSR